MKCLAVCLVAVTTFGPAQSNQAQNNPSKTIPTFTGTWTLDLHRTTFEGKAHPPIAAEVVIRYDGTHWYRWRSHTAPDGKVDTHDMKLIVDSPKPLVVKQGPLTFYSRITRDGDALILHQDIVANTGEKATNTVRYSLEDDGKTLVEFEEEKTPAGNETNCWVSARKK
jgi:hypothetical protein